MPDEVPTFRVATWNILYTPHDYSPRMYEVVEQLNRLRPDVILIQEAAQRAEHYDALDYLANSTGYQLVARGTIEDRKETPPFGKDHHSQVGILTRFPVLERMTVPLPSGPSVDAEACLGVLELPSGAPLVASSAHLAWGGAAEGYRFAQAASLDYTIQAVTERYSNLGQQPIAILAGDFNATPESKTLRWLRGLESGTDGAGTYWVDAWLAGGDGSDGFTSRPDNPLAQQTAHSVGITSPDRNPYRRIDYILVRGWVHGRPGDPLRAGLFGNEPVTGIFASDHVGLWADIRFA